MTEEIKEEVKEEIIEKYIETDDDSEKRVSDDNVEMFGRQINMGDITMEEYNKFVSRVGNKFIVPEKNCIKCVCGNYHPIEKTSTKKKVFCPIFNFNVSGSTLPKIYEKWIKLQVQFILDIEDHGKKISNK